MLTHSRRSAFITFAVLVAAIVFFIVSIPLTRNDQNSAASQEQREALQRALRTRAEQEQRASSPQAPNWHAILTDSKTPQWVLAILTAFTLWAIWEQAIATGATAKAAEESIRLTHRPRIVVRGVTAINMEETIPKNLGGGYVLVTNIGSNPAVIDFVHVDWLVAERLPMNNPMFDATSLPMHAEIPVGGFVMLETSDRTMTDEQFSSLQKGETKFTIFLLGYVKYIDKSKARRRTYFCRRFDPERRRFVRVRDTDYEYEE